MVAPQGNDLPLFLRIFPLGSRGSFLRRPGSTGGRSDAAGGGASQVDRRAAEWKLRAARRRTSASDAPRASVREMFARYVPSRRHTMQLDYDEYLAELGRGDASRAQASAASRGARRARGTKRLVSEARIPARAGRHQRRRVARATGSRQRRRPQFFTRKSAVHRLRAEQGGRHSLHRAARRDWAVHDRGRARHLGVRAERRLGADAWCSASP